MIQIENIVLGLITAGIIWLIKKVIELIVDFFCMKSQGFDLTGCWYAEHGSYISSEIKAIEVIYIWHRGENIKYRMEQYTNFEDTKNIFIGKGIVKAGVISSFYYPRDRFSKLIGCMNLTIKTKSASELYLSGSFYEVDERKEKYSFDDYPNNYYKMYRIPLDFKRKIKLMYWKNVFGSFREVQKYIGSFG